MIRSLFITVLVLLLSFNCLAAEQGTLLANSSMLQNFHSVLVIVNENGNSMPADEEILSDECKALQVPSVPESLSWKVYQMSGKSDSLDEYQAYLREAFDTALQADVSFVDDMYQVRFNFVDFLNPELPVLFQKEYQCSGERSVALRELFHTFVQELVILKSSASSSAMVDVSKLNMEKVDEILKKEPFNKKKIEDKPAKDGMLDGNKKKETKQQDKK